MKPETKQWINLIVNILFVALFAFILGFLVGFVQHPIIQAASQYSQKVQDALSDYKKAIE